MIPTDCPESINNNCVGVIVKNSGHFVSPFLISSYKNDSLLNTQWFEGFNGTKKVTFSGSGFDKLIIDGNEIMPDMKRRNNTLRAKGILKRTEPLQLKFLAGVERSDRTQLFYSPLVGYNEYDHMLLGMAFYNSLIPSKKMEFILAPLYGLGSKSINGFASAFYNWYPLGSEYNFFKPGNYFRNIKLGIVARKFSDFNSPVGLNYSKIAPELNMTILKKQARSNVTQVIRIRNVNIIQQMAQYSYMDKNYSIYNYTYYVNEVSYLMKNKRKLNPCSADLVLQQGNGFVKTWVEGNYRFSFRKTRGLDLRFYSGKFLSNDLGNDFGFGMSGNNDYMRDHLFFDRNRAGGWISQQFAMNEGGFKNSYSTYASNNWMTAINMMCSTPFRIPIRFYADAGVGDRSTALEYDAGIALTPFPGILEIYFPVFMAKELNKNNYGEKIRFVFNINQLNPWEIIKNIAE